MAAAAYGYLFNDRSHPSASAYFGNADVVMYPKNPALNLEFFIGLPKTYGTELDHRFQLAAESSLWRLYRRR
jgi:hypothetical protein